MTDRSWESAPALPPAWERVRSVQTSHYVTMRDGVRIAVLLHLPASTLERMPAIVRQTRYLRALEPRAPLVGSLLAREFDLYARTRRIFLAAGYAWVDVDVRGSGASSGVHAGPWAPDEVKDGAEIVDWIVKSPWSNGEVGSLGISYDGTAAEMLLVNQHPAVRAVAPLFSLFDVYADVAFPGGVQLAWFLQAWSRYNAALDRGAFGDASSTVVGLIARAARASPRKGAGDRIASTLATLGGSRFEPIVATLMRGLVAGVVPVSADRAELAQAIAEHASNFDVWEGAQKITYRDDAGISALIPDGTIDTLSPHHHASAIQGSGAAVYSYSGWRDGAYPNGAIKRHRALATKGGRLTVGPWVHTGKLRIRPWDTAVPASFDHDAELLGFFDEHLGAAPRAGERAPVRYYTFVEEQWKAAPEWPPPSEPEILYLADARKLSESAKGSGADVQRVDLRTGTGPRSRWRSLLSLVPGDYPDRRERDAALLFYDSPPLERDIEVTGHPVAVLFVSWDDDDDGRVFAYLEDVAPDGRVAYVTEGQLRALHRRTTGGERRPCTPPEHSFRREHAHPLPAGEVGELAFELLPISWRFERGHRVRLAVAGGDADHFAPSRVSMMRVHRAAARPSRIELPIVRAR